MANVKSGGKVRVGIAGLDHWYIGLEAAKSAAAHPDVELAVVAHRDRARAEETAQACGAVEATTDYASVAQRDDLDIVVTACRSSENPDICIEAARRGSNILSVKPVAMSREESDRVNDAVKQAGIRFFSWESNYRLNGRYKQVKRWIEEGRIGRPISAAYVMRAGLPTQVWPNVEGETWWLDPAHTPGGGWIDHSIYAVDLLRWLFGAEVDTAGGVVSTLVHHDLSPEMEDFGLATLTFSGGQVASIEVTWTAAPGAFITSMHIVGSEGSILIDSSAPSRATISGNFDPFRGWSTVTLSQEGDNPLNSMVSALREGTSLPANVGDACRNLDTCLTFYQAAREGRSKQVGLQAIS